MITKVEKRQQGNKNNEVWVLARKNQAKQCCVMLGEITKHDLSKQYSDASIPDQFNPDKLPTFDR